MDRDPIFTEAFRHLLAEAGCEPHRNWWRQHRGLDSRTVGRPELPELSEHRADFAEEDVLCDHRFGGVPKRCRWKTAA